jgi:hypothetical protein
MNKLFAFLICSGLLFGASGCGKKPEGDKPPAAKGKEHTHPHPHSHGEGPHGGTLSDWGGGAYHVEFTVDHGKKEATVYVLGSDEKTPAPIKTDKVNLVINDPMSEIELKAMPLDGEAAGSASRFVGTHDTLGIVKEYAGTLSAEVGGTPYTGDFKEEPHAEEPKK